MYPYGWMLVLQPGREGGEERDKAEFDSKFFTVGGRFLIDA